VRYAVGYKPLYLRGNFVGVLAVPAPYRQRDIEEDLARRNSYYVAVYAIIVIIIMLVGWGVAQQLSTPVRQLTLAARQVGKGNLDVSVEPRSWDEIGELVRSFDQMVGEIKASRANLASAERKLAWSEMAKQVAHEIKNPLTPMKLSIQHLRHAFKDKAKDLPKIVDSTTQTIVEQIDALSRIATEFSHFARLPEKRFERIDINQAIQDCADLFSNIKGIEIRTKFDDHDCHIITDRDELRRVFINILRNSVQAMHKGGVITIRSQRINNTCRIQFTDAGEGIPKDVLPRVFDPNFSTKTDGTGLGLAISQKIIQELNGTITISSEVGKGTTVEISLPV
jgi:nitrogen fixation/metabolism regulation signal transduction histidine kinase